MTRKTIFYPQYENGTGFLKQLPHCLTCWLLDVPVYLRVTLRKAFLHELS